LPDLAAPLLQKSVISKGAARGTLCILAAQAFAFQLLCSLFKVLAHLFGEVLVKAAAAKDRW
jgi:hypothetical protein